MAKQCVKYTETTNKTIKAVGLLDVSQNAIIVDGEVVNISALLSEFDGTEINFSLSMKTETELDTPEAEDTYAADGNDKD
jgi:DUF1009 family protein